MALKDASALASQHALKGAGSPFEPRQNKIDFSAFPLAANNVDQLNAIPLYAGEFVLAAWARVETPTTNGAVTVTLTDSRNAGAILANFDISQAANTQVKAAGASIGVMGTQAQGAGFLQVQNSHATLALANGIVTFYAIVGFGF